MEKVINLNIPHVSEKILENIDTDDLIKWLKVSKTWKILAENVLVKRWKGKLIEASRHGKIEIVKLLLERTETQLEARNEDGNTAFHLACFFGHNDVVQLLMNGHDKNIDLNIRGIGEMTALMMASLRGHKDVVQLLLNSDQNIDLNTQDNDGHTAFMHACYFGHKDVVQLLLNSDQNIELNTRDNSGWTAFQLACYQRHKDVVNLLLDNDNINVGK